VTIELQWPYVPPDGWTAADLGRTYYEPDDVVLVVEVVSKSSEIRDRETKPKRVRAKRYQEHRAVPDRHSPGRVGPVAT
jgi:Uma2 family endonuclease